MDEAALPEERAIGARLRALRREKGFSLETLAGACTVSRSMLSKIERGESLPTVGVAVRIASALAVPLPRLLGVEEHPEVLFRPAAYQEVVADPRSGTTRYQLLQKDSGMPRIERFVAPPGAAALDLPAIEAGRVLAVTVSEGRLELVCGDEVWSAGEGDLVAFPGPTRVSIRPHAGELGVALLVTAKLV